MMGALMLALGVMAFALGLETSQRFLEWKMLRGRTEAAAVAGTLELDGTPAGMERARKMVVAMTGAAPEQVRVSFTPAGDGMRVTVAKDVAISATAQQRPVGEPDSRPEIGIAAPKPASSDFGLVRDAVYKAKRTGGETVLGRIVPVEIHSGFPKEVPLTWIAGRIVGVAGDDLEIAYLGGYLRGARHGAVAAHGYFEVKQ